MNLYEKGLEAARRGAYEEALRDLQGHLEANPQDGRAWNDAGVVLYTWGQHGEAAASLERARELECEPGCVDSNLFCAYLAAGRIKEAVEVFAGMYEGGTAGEEQVEEAVSMLLERGEAGAAAELVIRARGLRPGGRLDEILGEIRGRRAKIAFFCGGDGDTFLRDILEFVGERFETRVFEGDRVEQVRDLMAWSDISWFEWCTNLAEIGSKLPRLCKNVVRLHRYEAYTGWPERINWGNVDVLVTVGNRAVEEALEGQKPGFGSRTRVVRIPNGVNLEKIRFVRRRRGKNIAFVGNMRFVKNPMFMLQCMKKLCEADGEYRLFVAGRTQDIEVEQYVRHMVRALGLEGNVFLDGWQGDVEGWLADKHYILCTSVIESQGMGVLEAMAAGLRPAVHNFPGAEGIYPQDVLFNTAEEFCGIVTGAEYAPGRYRAFVEERYSLRTQLERVGGLLGELERGADSCGIRDYFQGFLKKA